MIFTCGPTRRQFTLAAAAATTAWPSLTPAQAGSAADDLLAARLAISGVGLVAVQTAQREFTVSVRGEAHAGTALAPDAVFEVGSITKTFTALLLADAVVTGRLKLDDAIEDTLGSLKLRDKDGRPLRWIDVATHRSGLPRLPGNLKPATPHDPYADYGEAQLREFIGTHKATLPRQSPFGYSNLGYGLLGYALGLAAGKEYETLLKERVLQPLGLTGAQLALTGRAPPSKLVTGHSAQRQPVPHWHFGVLAPAGALLLDGATLARYAQAAAGAFTHPLEEAFALCLKIHATDDPPTALGWLLGKAQGRWLASHDGNTFGFASALVLDPSRHRSAAVLSNSAVPVSDLATHLVEPSVPLQPPTSMANWQEVMVDVSLLRPLTGRYALNPQFKLDIRVRDGKLWAQATGQDEFQLFATAPRRYFARVTPLTIEFEGREGAPRSLKLAQSGALLEFKREP